jgi:SpoVK/Ycf46/Vps4 family AAA+-type ATPase
MVSFAQRIEPRPGTTLDDVILPPPNKQQLKELQDRINLRDRVYRDLGFEECLTLGQGLVVLFTGSSGTGKTFAASILASSHQVDLYKVDLASLVSKYIGDTEKNLNRLFADAQDANAILFFDEADAIFGKRGEVEDARDRWANLEVNYLLQRVEEYTGTVILATNLRQNLDDAFLRRIHVLVDFPFPESPFRLQIYKRLFPKQVDIPDEKDLRELADRFALSGGGIRNVVLDAAFRAAAEAGKKERPKITIKHLVLGVAREYQKLSRPVTPGEFGPVWYPWVTEAWQAEPKPRAYREPA